MHLRSLLLLPLLAGCTAVPPPSRPAAPPPPARPVVTSVPPTRPVTPPVTGFRTPEIQRIAGLENVIEQDAASLTRQFGQPRLDVHEGDMRKLQFAGSACVLDVFLYPSHSEGISNALMEGMAAGCPIVAARCPGNETVLGEGTAIFVPPSDPQALSSATLGLLNDAQAAARIGGAAARRIETEFGARRMAEGFEALYRECLAAKGIAA